MHAIGSLMTLGGKRTLQLWFGLPLDKPNALHADDVAYRLRSGALGLFLR
jgi:hypothetical protein